MAAETVMNFLADLALPFLATNFLAAFLPLAALPVADLLFFIMADRPFLAAETVMNFLADLALPFLATNFLAAFLAGALAFGFWDSLTVFHWVLVVLPPTTTALVAFSVAAMSDFQAST